MTQPQPLGDRAGAVLDFVADKLRQNKGLAFDAAILMYGEDRNGALALLKALDENDSLVRDIVVFLQAKRLPEAEELVMSARKRQRNLELLPEPKAARNGTR